MHASAEELIVCLNSIARHEPYDRWDGMIPVNSTPDEIARRARFCLVTFYREREGHLEPDVLPCPDEVIVQTCDGRRLFRWTIVDEWAARDQERDQAM